MKTALLRTFNLSEDRLLGEGGESWVYALNSDTVLRVYKNGDLTRDVTKMRTFYEALDWQSLGFTEQKIMGSGISGGYMYTLEKRIPGQDFAKALRTLSGEVRRQALDEFFQKSQLLHMLDTCRHTYFGEAIHAGHSTTQDWTGYLEETARRKLGADFAVHRKRLLREFAALCAELHYSGQPNLVHFDYFPGNVMFSDSSITGVIDFSLSIYGDPLLDVAGAVGYFGLTVGVRPTDSAYLLRKMMAAYSLPDLQRLTTYLIFMAIYWSGCDDLPVAKWATRILRTWIDSNYASNQSALWDAVIAFTASPATKNVTGL